MQIFKLIPANLIASALLVSLSGTAHANIVLTPVYYLSDLTDAKGDFALAPTLALHVFDDITNFAFDISRVRKPLMLEINATATVTTVSESARYRACKAGHDTLEAS